MTPTDRPTQTVPLSECATPRTRPPTPAEARADLEPLLRALGRQAGIRPERVDAAIARMHAAGHQR